MLQQDQKILFANYHWGRVKNKFGGWLIFCPYPAGQAEILNKKQN